MIFQNKVIKIINVFKKYYGLIIIKVRLINLKEIILDKLDRYSIIKL